MIDENGILELCDRIAAEFKPQRIVLFGSRAAGTQDEHSDIDLLIVMRYTGSGIRKTIEILNHVNPKVPVDLVLRTLPGDPGTGARKRLLPCGHHSSRQDTL